MYLKEKKRVREWSDTFGIPKTHIPSLFENAEPIELKVKKKRKPKSKDIEIEALFRKTITIKKTKGRRFDLFK